MAELGDNINQNSFISLSRNTPVALVVGAGGFLGSHVAEQLLEKGIQVIGVDDFSSGHKRNLSHAVKERNFHLFNQPMEHPFKLNLPRLDYEFYVADKYTGVRNFLDLAKQYSPKIVFVSSISLYKTSIPGELRSLKHAEVELAKFVKDHRLNARVVRLAAVYGPRMHFREDDPVVRLIQAALLDELQKEQTSLEFSSRAIYIDDAVDLLIKTVLSGSTAQKIYDGAGLEPVKVSEIKQILLDPIWYEEKGFKKTELPPWKTPNLDKTVKELSWKPKTGLISGLKRTIAYFKDNNIEIPKIALVELEREARGWGRETPGLPKSFQDQEPQVKENSTKEEEKRDEKGELEVKRMGASFDYAIKKLPIFLAVALIVYALVFPLITLIFGAWSLRLDLINSKDDLAKGDFVGAELSINSAQATLSTVQSVLGSTGLMRRLGLFNAQLDNISEVVSEIDEGLSGVAHATAGAKALSDASLVMSGENNQDPHPLFDKAKVEFGAASVQLSAVNAKLDSTNWNPDLASRLKLYSSLVEKGRAVANFLPQLVALDGKSSYIVLFENSSELRPGGGAIEAYARLDFEGGKLTNLKVDNVTNLDANLTEQVTPPPEIKSDLGKNNFTLADSNFDPDFPTAANLAEFFYVREAGVKVNGVIALDLNGTEQLLSSVGGVDLSDFGEHVDDKNLAGNLIAHQGNRNSYLVAVESALFNKIFFLPNTNRSAIAQAFSNSLDRKHMLLFLNDPALFSVISAENWAGVIKRPSPPQDGITEDFLAMVDSNMGQDQANYFLSRSYHLATQVDKDSNITHTLTISYKNSSDSSGYKNRFRVYLPLGTKLNSAIFGGNNITNNLSTFSDYNRTGYSILITVPQKQSMDLVLNYQLSSPMAAKYNLFINKEPGTDKDSFDWKFNYTVGTLTSIGDNPATTAKNEVDLSTDLEMDRTLSVGLSK